MHASTDLHEVYPKNSLLWRAVTIVLLVCALPLVVVLGLLVGIYAGVAKLRACCRPRKPHVTDRFTAYPPPAPAAKVPYTIESTY
ncbi:hypothetical protein SPRG_16749, partial [Saprolegnia parasitica CBS 223.65]